MKPDVRCINDRGKRSLLVRHEWRKAGDRIELNYRVITLKCEVCGDERTRVVNRPARLY